ncbi:MAG: nicotinate (nicotinamide) nucleotide adenylyltransferase [Chloroflexi bacterium]|nr:MAG: nicotinate (nicotinamide) nucleotide adenylyltransferase [Chloroflexota bacterium]TMC71049.1 MAG: nicotinate (nicotinamide) nucleotide adenylyltransferase [Chloroflexota bacterium]
MRIGLLGGTFDPIHAGHLAAAKAALDCAELDRVMFIPAAQPPHRPRAIATADDRLEMCRLAIEGDTRFVVSDVELERGGPSYTVDTLAELRRSHPGDQLLLILGWDAARLFSTWRRPDEVRALATIVVVARPGSAAPRKADLEPAGLGGQGVILCLEPTPDVSASEIRRALASGESIAGKVPAAVERYIAAHHLYAG